MEFAAGSFRAGTSACFDRFVTPGLSCPVKPPARHWRRLSKHFDILGIKMFDSCEIRVHPTGKAIARFGTKSQGQGHETTYAQILTEELGIPAAHIEIEEGDTDTAPYGLGTYASRSTPTAGAAAALAARKVRAKGVGESATVGALPAIANAVVDALAHLGVKHVDIPTTPEKVWRILKEKRVAE